MMRPTGPTTIPGASTTAARTIEPRPARKSARYAWRSSRESSSDGSGVAAAKLAFVLTLLGHEDVAVYDGGWADWGNRLDLPVDR